MPTTRTRRKRGRRFHSLAALQLAFGVPGASLNGGTPIYESEEERREAWEYYRASLLNEAGPGHRPAAWWEYDAPEPRDRTIGQSLQLDRLGLLTPDERAKCEPHWAASLKSYRRPYWDHDPAAADRMTRDLFGIPDDFMPGFVPEGVAACGGRR